MSYVKVQGNSSLAKDPISGAVINIDNDAYAAALIRKKRVAAEKKLLERIDSLEMRIDELEKKLQSLLA
jgi:tetrahydromethanopterin S-methyltransferase subunit B